MAIQSIATPYEFQAYETSGGAHIFRIPMKVFPNLWAYAYLVIVDDMIVLIDTGSGFGDSNVHLEAGFDQASRAYGKPIHIGDLTHILITHGHIDHFGGLIHLIEHSHALVGIHELDLNNLTNYEERVAFAEKRLKAYLIEAGTTEKKRKNILEMYRMNKLLFHSVKVDFTYQTKGMQLGPFEMLHVPGHCAGHVVIRLHDLLFCGDHVLSKITPHQSPEQLTLYTGLGHYLDALASFEKWSCGSSLALAGHDDPITDLSARIAEIHHGHIERLELVLEFLVKPHTVSDVAKELFGSVNGYNILLAIEEAGAYIEFLHQRGFLRIVNAQDDDLKKWPVINRYQRANDAIVSLPLP
jgi:glyoxylase-like metal-dependent hydrolase (beta-lactamase superfamily II)